ncbi:MBL fold metallo-hydrolase [Luteipulveratus sp. YIM 133132]|uniref:MBL fold metallo-hydrolase n=1 Tax=Luteipulveratus flavus TaxID=3031728 RepID=UPI0023B114C4|nr:MBL fold metallo-hydrolase [Luteipulveratus sp. YIM 133132]MDE9367495.1 MBL fold metallo-hydrolase [Luteipulveratus sp. YIM 133132]
MKVTHLGHSCLLVESAGARVLIDPGTFSDFDAVDGLDAILITHQHPDHCDPEKIEGLIARNPQARVGADPQTSAVLQGEGLEVSAHEAGAAYEVGSLTVTPAGRLHAEIHPYIDRIDNLGVLLAADGEPSLFHPGDALDAEPAAPVDVLAVPVSAPWCAVKETIAFVRRIQPGRVVPIHDALLVPPARGMYLKHVGDFGLDGGVEVVDLAGAGPRDL